MSVQRYIKQTDTLTPIAGRIANESADLQTIRKSSNLNGKVASASAVKTIDAEISGVEGMMSDEWNNTKTYALGEYCIYDNKLWRCKIQHSGQTPGEGEYWENTSVNASLPFKLGIDASGNYGYYKVGADSVTPFKNFPDISKAQNVAYACTAPSGSGLNAGYFNGTKITTTDSFNATTISCSYSGGYTFKAKISSNFAIVNLRSHTLTKKYVASGETIISGVVASNSPILIFDYTD